MKSKSHIEPTMNAMILVRGALEEVKITTEVRTTIEARITIEVRNTIEVRITIEVNIEIYTMMTEGEIAADQEKEAGTNLEEEIEVEIEAENVVEVSSEIGREDEDNVGLLYNSIIYINSINDSILFLFKFPCFLIKISQKVKWFACAKCRISAAWVPLVVGIFNF